MSSHTYCRAVVHLWTASVQSYLLDVRSNRQNAHNHQLLFTPATAAATAAGQVCATFAASDAQKSEMRDIQPHINLRSIYTAKTVHDVLVM